MCLTIPRRLKGRKLRTCWKARIPTLRLRNVQIPLDSEHVRCCFGFWPVESVDSKTRLQKLSEFAETFLSDAEGPSAVDETSCGQEEIGQVKYPLGI